MDFADEVSGSEYFVIVLKNLRSNERVWSAKSKKSHIFIVKLYFHCYAHINITSEQFSLLIRIIFTLLLYIFVATSYFHCKPVLLHAHICIAN